MTDDAKRARWAATTRDLANVAAAARKVSGLDAQARRRRWQLRESLLERALFDLRGELASMVEAACELAWDGMDHVPVPGTASQETVPAIADRVLLIREIEAEIGRPAEHPEPQWLDGLLDGKWVLT